MDEETRRFDVELFADVFADLTRSLPPPQARFRFVAMVNARQFRRQGLRRCVCAGAVRRRFSLLFQFGHDGGAIFVAGFRTNRSRRSGESKRFALQPKRIRLWCASSRVSCWDLQFAPFEFGVALDEFGITFGELALQGKNLRQDLILSCEINAVP